MILNGPVIPVEDRGDPNARRYLGPIPSVHIHENLNMQSCVHDLVRWRRYYDARQGVVRLQILASRYFFLAVPSGVSLLYRPFTMRC